MQTCSSANTSLKQIPSVLKRLPETTNGESLLDYGCGRNHEAIAEHVHSRGYTYVGYDPNWLPVGPFGVYDVVACCNVLNVLDDDRAVYKVIADVMEHVAPGGAATFQIYEGDKSGIGRYTKRDCYQRNERTRDYWARIKEVANDDANAEWFVMHSKNVLTAVRIG